MRKNKSSESMDSLDTVFPQWQEKHAELEQILRTDGCLCMIFIDSTKLGKIEGYYGKEVYSRVVQKLKQVILDLRGSQIRKDDIIVTNYHKGNLYFIFLSSKRDRDVFKVEDIEGISRRLLSYINIHITKIVDPLFRDRIRIHVGHAIGIRNPLIGLDTLIHRMIEDAKRVAAFQDFRDYIEHKHELQEIILGEKIHTLFQPIVEFEHFKIIGYEALSRGPAGTPFENPLFLFSVADETGLSFELDRLCRKKAFHFARDLPDDKKIFINILPITIRDPEFHGKFIHHLVKTMGFSPQQIVFEVSEQKAIENFKIFLAESQRYLDMGFTIAIDDAGTGYSNFNALVELKLRYIKLDISLIQELHQNEVKRQIVRSMINISRTIHADIIAEGIEDTQELEALIDLGIQYGQGFLFARPGFPLPEITVPRLSE